MELLLVLTLLYCQFFYFHLKRFSVFVHLLQGLLFSSMDCLTQPTDLVRLWMHESQRVYGDKFTDDKDSDAFMKIQIDIVKKSFDVSRFHRRCVD